jgi:hypothetical protein
VQADFALFFHLVMNIIIFNKLGYKMFNLH